jgi:hypothetical protein
MTEQPTSSPGFEAPVEISEGVLGGPWRAPRQMLAAQDHGSHGSIHDDATARRFGFKGGTIEGPTHFTQFAPLCAAVWGRRWFEMGCLSVHYKNACLEGEEVRAMMKKPQQEAASTVIWMEKRDGTEILRGSASVGPEHPRTALDLRLATIARPDRLEILRDVEIGMKSRRQIVALPFDQRMGRLYPFSLDEKLVVITEPSAWYTRAGGVHSPWGRPIIPFEMISVLLRYSDDVSPFPLRGSVVQLFADQEIRLAAGPLFVGEHYEIEHEVVALSSSRRTEGLWIQTRVYPLGSNALLAAMLLNLASLKGSNAR